MNKKKFWITVIVAFILTEATNFLIHGVFLKSTYESEGIKEIFRNMEEMNSRMWVMWITDFLWVYFFIFIFVKGYENKGIMEGMKYGLYIGIFVSLVFSYQSYVIYPIPYSLAFQWFIYGLIQCVLLGVVAALVYKPKPVAG